MYLKREGGPIQTENYKEGFYKYIFLILRNLTGELMGGGNILYFLYLLK